MNVRNGFFFFLLPLLEKQKKKIIEIGDPGICGSPHVWSLNKRDRLRGWSGWDICHPIHARVDLAALVGQAGVPVLPNCCMCTPPKTTCSIQENDRAHRGKLFFGQGSMSSYAVLLEPPIKLSKSICRRTECSQASKAPDTSNEALNVAVYIFNKNQNKTKYNK